MCVNGYYVFVYCWIYLANICIFFVNINWYFAWRLNPVNIDEINAYICYIICLVFNSNQLIYIIDIDELLVYIT